MLVIVGIFVDRASESNRKIVINTILGAVFEIHDLSEVLANHCNELDSKYRSVSPAQFREE
jgi:hypothetical protein